MPESHANLIFVQTDEQATYKQNRAIPAAFTREPILGTVVEMRVCGSNRC